MDLVWILNKNIFMIPVLLILLKMLYKDLMGLYLRMGRLVQVRLLPWLGFIKINNYEELFLGLLIILYRRYRLRKIGNMLYEPALLKYTIRIYWIY